MDDAPIAVGVVEDNDVFREALELLFGLEPDIVLVVSASTGAEALERIPSARPEVVLLDYRLPDLDGVETARALRAACPETAIVALTAAADDRELEALLEVGAVTCLRKGVRIEEIVVAVREAAGRGAAPR